MRINFTQFDLASLPQLPAVTALSGDEAFLKEHCATQLCAYWQARDYHLTHFDLGQTGQLDALTQALKCISLFEPARILLVRVKKISDLKSIQAETWKNLLTPPAQIVLIWLLPKLDQSTQRASWCSQLEKNGLHLVFWPLNANQHLQWLLHSARGMSLALSFSQARRITEFSEGNPQASIQVLQRLSLRFGQSPISDSALTEELDEACYFHAFDLAASCLRGEAQRALQQLKRLQAEQEEPLMILGALAYEIRQYLNSSTKTVPPSRKAMYQQAQRRHHLPAWWWQQLHRIATLETLCKTRSFDVWRAMSQLVLALLDHPPSLPEPAAIPCHAEEVLW